MLALGWRRWVDLAAPECDHWHVHLAARDLLLDGHAERLALRLKPRAPRRLVAVALGEANDDVLPDGGARLAELLVDHLQDLVRCGVEPIRYHVVVQHEDRVDVPQCLELVVQIRGELLEDVARFLLVDIAAGWIVVAWRVDHDQFALRIATHVHIGKGRHLGYRVAAGVGLEDGLLRRLITLSGLRLPDEIEVGLLRLHVPPASNYVQQCRLAAARAPDYDEPLA
mmetsp:Transcript_36736/g.97065  ORF Transcript_36736/g.97065 Transcript_36736/m.97065 type:complete len:226 (+) Transcript_36736:795-1472(+)